MIKKRCFLITALIGFFWCLNAYAQYSVQSLPNPKLQGNDHYVSDPDGNLSAGTRAELDAISVGIEQNNGSEFAIVVVNDFQGDSAFEFALNLFEHWGIGKAGSDNGLLLFLSMDRREYRFTTGYGLEGIFPDALLSQIAQRYLVPYMKAGNTDMAVLAAAKAVESVFLSPTHEMELTALSAYQPTFWNRNAAALEQTLAVLAVFVIGFFWMNWARKRVAKKFGIGSRRYKGHAFWYAFFTFLIVLFLTMFVFLALEVGRQVYQVRNLPWFLAVFGALWLLYHYYGCREFLVKSTRDVKTALDMRIAFTRLTLVPLLLSPFAYKAYFDLEKSRRYSRLRETPPTQAGNWKRLHRDRIKRKTLKKYLTDVQIKEESLGAKSYEIWLDRETGGHHVAVFDGANVKRYEVCPRCEGRTMQRPEIKVRQRATRTATGTGERIKTCAFCDYKISLGMVTLAKLGDGSSSSSGGSGGGGGGSSGGSFGGGSSGGGGAGGRW